MGATEKTKADDADAAYNAGSVSSKKAGLREALAEFFAVPNATDIASRRCEYSKVSNRLSCGGGCFRRVNCTKFRIKV